MRGSFFLGCFACIVSGCSSSAADTAALGSGGGPGLGGTGAGGEVGGARSLGFDEVPELAAREQVVLRVHARPAGSYRVRFSLPATKGDPLDAVLDRSESDTDASGVAEVVLTAPSASAEFTVRASIDATLAAELPVSVKDTGFTTVHVQPKYLGPYRNIETWTATVHPKKSCAKLPGIPPADGPFWGIAPKDAAPTVTDVPALTPLAVTLRSGHYVGGCASVEMLAPGGAHVVQVNVLNRPIELAQSRLALSLGLTSVAPAWQDFLLGAEQAVLTALLGTSSSDVDALLDAMRGAAGASQQTLETSRKTEGWDALLATHWGASTGTRLSSTIQGWLTAGRTRLLPGDHVIQGAVDVPGASDAELDLLTVAGISAERAGFATPARISWSATSDDQVHISSDIYVIASRLATGLAEVAALAASEEAEDAASALADALDCAGVASALATAGADQTLAYPGCDVGCLEQLCEDASATLWQRAQNATALAPARLIMSASGEAYVGDTAEVAGISGSWLGTLEQGNDDEPALKTGGSLKATTPKD